MIHHYHHHYYYHRYYYTSAYNAPPVINNLDTTVTVNENVGAGFPVLDLAAVDTTVYTDIYINMRSSSSAGIEMYELVGKLSE